MEKRKFVYIPLNGPIPELNFVTGPVGPTYVSMDVVKKLVQNGKPVFEVDPKNHSKRVKLELTNMKNENMKVSSPENQNPVTPEETPVQESVKDKEPETVEPVEPEKSETPEETVVKDSSVDKEPEVTESETEEKSEEVEAPVQEPVVEESAQPQIQKNNNKNHKNKKNR